MIFGKYIYSKSSFFKSLRKRISLAMAPGKTSEIFIDKGFHSLPRSKAPIKRTAVDDLNQLCHVNAFSFKDSQMRVDSYFCDGCQECTTYSELEIIMQADNGSSENERFHALFK